jgi:hypothetical protein
VKRLKAKGDFEVKKDCFAFKNGDCIALNDLYCAKEKCSFYKSKEEYNNGLLQSKNR